MNFAILTIVILYTIALAYTIKKRKKEDAAKEKEFWDREHDANFTRKKSIADLEYVTIPDNITSIAMNIDLESSDEDSNEKHVDLNVTPENSNDEPADSNVTPESSNVGCADSNVTPFEADDENAGCDDSDLQKLKNSIQVILKLSAAASQTDSSHKASNKTSNNKILNLNGITNTELKLTYGAANLSELSEFDQNYSDLIVALDTVGNHLRKINMTKSAIEIYEYAVSIHTDIASSYISLAQMYIEENKKELIHLLIKNCESLSSLRKNSIIRHLNSLLDAE